MPGLCNVVVLLGALTAAGGKTAPSRPGFVLRVEVEGMPLLSARYCEGVSLLLPAAWKVKVVPEGGADLRLPGEWFDCGGMEISRTGGEYVLFTPQLEGTFRWKAGGKDVRVFVAVPAERNGLRVRVGKRWEKWPDPAGSRNERVVSHRVGYLPPALFFSLSRFGREEFLPGVKGRDFLPLNRAGKRPGQWFAVSPALLNKLALAEEAMKETGLDPGSLRIVSGFRPPSYNRRIRGAAPFSRHMYGDAVDVIIDSDSDGAMDDVTGDGKVDRADGKVLADFFRRAEEWGAEKGGIGIYEYGAASRRRCHVHADARGFVTRWGTTFRSGRPGPFRWWPKEEFDGEDED